MRHRLCWALPLLMLLLPALALALPDGSACTLDSQCDSGNCKSDYDGSGSWCAQSVNCCHDGNCGYSYWAAAPGCASPEWQYVCSGGAGAFWTVRDCNVDNSCNNVYGGCSLSDRYCSGGSCISSGTTYYDECTGTVDSPSARTYTCNGVTGSGAACTSSTTSGCTDSCSSSGSSCSATDCTCSSGVLSSNSDSSSRSCSGSCQELAPACVNGDGGSISDSCGTTPTNYPADTSCQYNYCVATSGRLIVQNNAGTVEAIIDKYGRILLRGYLYQSTGTTPPAGSLQIKDGSNVARAWITSAGHLYLKGTASQSQGSITPSANNDFIIQNAAGTPMCLIDGATGSLYTRSTIVQTAIT